MAATDKPEALNDLRAQAFACGLGRRRPEAFGGGATRAWPTKLLWDISR